MKTMHSILATALVAATTMQSAGAADDELAQRVAACAREQNDAQRLACFDRAAATKAETAHAVAPETKADHAFGVHGSELARNRDDDESRPGSAPKRIAANVAAIDKRPRGELVFTLDNGQVWAQKEAGAYFPVKVGDSVAILAGSLGSFRLVLANRATAVTRVQ